MPALLFIAQSIEDLRIKAPRSTAMMRFRESVEGFSQGTYESEWCDFAEIDPMLWWSVVCAEDPYFFGHSGLYWPSIRLALKGIIRYRRVNSGGSTVTQQLAKNLFLTPQRSLGRKLREAVIALVMEKKLDKKRILELYLNYAEWGIGIWGCVAACRHYFNKSPSVITAFEGAFLASLLPAPRQGCALSRLIWLTQKQIRILSRMSAAGLIDETIWSKGCLAAVVLNRNLMDGAEPIAMVRYLVGHPPIEPSWARPLLNNAYEILAQMRRSGRMPKT